MNLETFLKLLGITNDITIDEILDSLIIYLRKSRKDMDYYKDETIEKTLERHEKQLQEFITNTLGKPIPEYNIYREVVSGDTIEGRPVMQKVLSLIEDNKYKAVVCIEVERLARGNTLDQGIIIQSFQYTRTKIITPFKIFNLDNEDDLSYFEDGLFQARKYLNYTKRILARGRVQSVHDGNYVGSVLPYGFDKVRIPGEKGFVLVHNEAEATNIRLMAELFLNGLKTTYTVEDGDTISSISKKFGIYKADLIQSNVKLTKDMDINKVPNNYFKTGDTLQIDIEDMRPPNIANYFNYLQIIPRKSKEWTGNMIRNILQSYPVYGYLTWNRRKTVKNLVNGQIKKSCPYNDDYLLAKGKHKAILDIETGKKIQEKFNHNHNTMPQADLTTKNPLKGLVICGYCNSHMIRRPYTNNKKKTILKRVYNIDKEELRLFLRENKGTLSLTQIAKELKVTKDVVAHWFSPNIKNFTIPKAEKWFELKKLLNIKDSKYDKAITTFEEIDVIPHKDTLLCTTKNCKCVGSNLDLVENHVLNTLLQMSENFKDYVNNYEQKVKEETNFQNNLLMTIDHEIEKTSLQIEKICELLETGAYTKELFLKRSTTLNQKLDSLKKQKEELSKTNNKTKELNYKKKAIPIIENVLNNYSNELTPEERNKIISMIVDKIIYTKESGGKNKMESFNLTIELRELD